MKKIVDAFFQAFWLWGAMNVAAAVVILAVLGLSAWGLWALFSG